MIPQNATLVTVSVFCLVAGLHSSQTISDPSLTGNPKWPSGNDNYRDSRPKYNAEAEEEGNLFLQIVMIVILPLAAFWQNLNLSDVGSAQICCSKCSQVMMTKPSSYLCVLSGVQVTRLITVF